MSTLESQLESLTDEIKDLFDALILNCDALQIQFKDSQPQLKFLKNCKKRIRDLIKLYQERQRVRLDHLITQQITEEDQKMRIDRLQQYEEKIMDQRRLINDKEAFYDSLLKKRIKKPTSMTLEEFGQLKRQQLSINERKNIQMLQKNISQLKIFKNAITNENNVLQKMLDNIENNLVSNDEVQKFLWVLKKNPYMYNAISLKEAESRINKANNYEEYRSMAMELIDVSCIEQHKLKQYFQEKELYKYLQWENTKLKGEYLDISKAKRHKKNTRKLPIKLQNRPLYQRSVSL